MRKSLILLIILLLASGIFLKWSADQLYSLRDQVTIEETTIIGDIAAAEGLHATLKTTLDNNLFWTTSHTIGSNQEPETEYLFDTGNSSRSYTYRSSNGIEYALNYDLDHKEIIYDDEGQFTGMAKAYKELYDATPDGRHGEKEVLLKDYLDYYPLFASFDILGKGFDLYQRYDFASYDDYFSGPVEAKYIFNDYFKIPVLEEETHTITISKENTGHTSGWSSGIGGSDNGDFYHPETYSVVTGDTVFFLLKMRSEVKDVPMDTSCLAEGYGIYSFSFETKVRANQSYAPEYPVVDPYSLHNAYPLDPLTRIIAFAGSNDVSYLHLLSELDGKYWFTAINAETMETAAHFELSDADSQYPYQCSMQSTEDFTVVFLSGCSEIAVISHGEDGIYKLEFITDYADDTRISLHYSDRCIAFDGERLAMGDTGYSYSSYDYFAGYMLTIITKDGVQYYGEYKTSLTTGAAYNGSSYHYLVQPVSEVPLVLEWTG